MVRPSLLLFAIPFALSSAACSGTDSVSINNTETSPTTLPNEPAKPGEGESKTPTTPGGEANARPDEPGTPPGPQTPKVKRVFVTNGTYKGNLREYAPQELDGFVAGDKICQTEAQAHKLEGTFKAYLSGKQKGQAVKAIDRLADVGAWYLVDGTTKAFDGRAGLAKNPLVKVDMLADGKRTTQSNGPWTGTKAGAPAGPSCEDNAGSSWLNANGSREGTHGNPTDLGRWSDDGSSRDCDEQAPLYCFEQ